MTIAVLSGAEELSGVSSEAGWADAVGYGTSAPQLPEPEPFPSPWPRPLLRLVNDDDLVVRSDEAGPDAGDPLGPGARAIQKGRRRTSARVRRRRLLVAGVAMSALVVGVVPFGTLLGGPLNGGNHSLAAAATSSGLPTSTRASQGTFYVVRPGDTLAAIAERIQPSNPDPVLAELAARIGSNRIVAGEHVPLS